LVRPRVTERNRYQFRVQVLTLLGHLEVIKFSHAAPTESAF